MEGRINRLERERDHPAHPGPEPEPETVELWASLFINAGIGIEESRAKAAALEFLEYRQTMGQTLRRHLAKRSRDFQRLGGAYGSNHPPTRVAVEQKDLVVEHVGDDS